MRTSLRVLLLAACAAAPAAASAQAPAGAWRLAFDGSGLHLATTVELRPDAAAGRMEATNLGPSGASVRLAPGPMTRDSFTLRALTARGAMVLHAAAAGDRIQGTWAAEDPLMGAFFHGTLAGTRLAPGAVAPITGTAVFDSVHALVGRAYFDPAFGGADWEALGREYRPRAAAASTDGAALEVVAEMLGKLGVTHLQLFASPAAAAAPGTSAGASPGPAREAVSWRALSPAAGYLRIASFPVGAAAGRAGAQLDSAFRALGALPGLVIDLRGNPGGGLELAGRLAAHLSPTPLRAGYFVTRAGMRRLHVAGADGVRGDALPTLEATAELTAEAFYPALERAGGAAMLVTRGGGADAYAGRVVVLVDRGSASTAEAVAAALAESGRATLVGTRTAGAMLSSAFFDVAPGWRLQAPVADYRTARGVRLEGTGVQPAVVLESAAEQAAIDRAEQVLREPPPAG